MQDGRHYMQAAPVPNVIYQPQAPAWGQMNPFPVAQLPQLRITTDNDYMVGC